MLDEDAVNVLITVELLDRADESLFVDVRGVLLAEGADSSFGAGLDLTGDVNGGGRVVADQNDGQSGNDSGFCTQFRDPGLALQADAGSDLLAIDYLGSHAVSITGSWDAFRVKRYRYQPGG